MKVHLHVIGKTDEKYLEQGIRNYVARIGNFLPFELVFLTDLKHRKHLSVSEQKKIEGNNILASVLSTDYMVLLDETGSQYDSSAFSVYLQKHMLSGLKRLVFVIGGPYGFSPQVYARANDTLSLSVMTFSHQMVRLIFVEQLYRALSIAKNIPYHHSG